jgi:hypothetical protein
MLEGDRGLSLDGHTQLLSRTGPTHTGHAGPRKYRAADGCKTENRKLRIINNRETLF